MFRTIMVVAVAVLSACSNDQSSPDNPGANVPGGKADQADASPGNTPNPEQPNPEQPNPEPCQPGPVAESLRFESTALDDETPGRFVSFFLQTDVDDDGQLDLIASIGTKGEYEDIPDRWKTAGVQLWKGKPDGQFELLEDLTTLASSAFGGLADANADGSADLVVASFDQKWTLKVLCGQPTAPFFVEDSCGDGAFASVDLPDNFYPFDVQVAPSSGEVLVAVAGMTYTGPTVQPSQDMLAIRWTSTSHTIQRLSEHLDEDQIIWSSLEFLAIERVDDGEAFDVVVTNGEGSSPAGVMLPQVFVFRQAFESTGGEVTALFYEGAFPCRRSQPRRPIVADFDQDGHQDIFVVNHGINDHCAGEPVLFYGTASGWTFAEAGFSFNMEPIEGYALDLDGNCLLDFVGMGSDLQGIMPTLQTSPRVFKSMAGDPALLSINGAHRDWLVFGDYNNDGRVDLVTASQDGTPLENPLPDRSYAAMVVHLQQ